MNNQWDKTFRYFVLVLIVIFLAWVFWSIREIFEPLATAAFLAYLFSPLVNLVSRSSRLSRKAAGNLVFFTAIAILIALPSIFLPIFFSDLQLLVGDLSVSLQRLITMDIRPFTLGTLRIDLTGFVDSFREGLTHFAAPLPEEALQLLETTSRGAAWFLVVVVVTYYLMTDWEKLRQWIIDLAPEPYQADMARLYSQVREVWMAYLRGQVLLMVIVAVVFTLIWGAIGLPGALAIGLLTGLFSLVPEIGPLTATLLAVVVALIEGSTLLPISNLWFALLVVAIYAVLINVKNVWLRPLIMGRSVNMHEGLVFVAIIAAVLFQGVLGALIVVPVLASLGVIGRYVRRRLLGQPPFDGDSIPEIVENPPPPPLKPRGFLRSLRSRKQKR